MGQEILRLVIETAVYLYTLLVVLRLLLQLVKADFYNPVSQFVVKATNPLVLPLRKIVPGLWGIDFASLLLALIVQALGWLLLFLLSGAISANPLLYVPLAAFGLVKVVLGFYFFAIIVLVVLSWVSPGNYNPVAAILAQLTEPVMAPFRRMLPDIGGLDLSPMLVLFILHILSNIVMPGLMASLLGGL